MRDPFEVMEDKIENWAFDNIKEDKFRCINCNKWTLLSEAVQLSPNPYALPICPKCSGDN